MRIKNRALKQVIYGTAVPCGSGCFMTSDGSQFLGKLPFDGLKEIVSLLSKSKLHAKQRTRLVEILAYVMEK